MRTPSPLLPALLLLAALLPRPAPAGEDPRLVYDATSPEWLRAVGKLVVPGVRYRDGYGSHRRENCSATLVGTPGSRRADTLVTAWHCLEDYRDLSRPITVTLRSSSGAAITREARRVADGGGMYADWAVLKLLQAVERSEVAPLPVHLDLADQALPVTMAGFSADAGLGAGGEILTYDPDCRITRQERRESESDCRAFKGASGGAVIQLDGDGAARICGVISRGDSASVSYFVPLQRFRSELNRFLD
ncbi:trypsin-like serine peptidase [Haliea sp. E17]|uniref:trypsin-like serine peptidase n=1 Tax=Haliea sp. E17 TaxID=3401576 RepID=UPI003AAC392C